MVPRGLASPPGPLLLCPRLSCGERVFSHLWSPSPKATPCRFWRMLQCVGRTLRVVVGLGVCYWVQETVLLGAPQAGVCFL